VCHSSGGCPHPHPEPLGPAVRLALYPVTRTRTCALIHLSFPQGSGELGPLLKAASPPAASPPPAAVAAPAPVAAPAAAAAAPVDGVPLEARLKSIISQQPVVLFMKGNPEEPRCGFSRKVGSVRVCTMAMATGLSVWGTPLNVSTQTQVLAGLKHVTPHLGAQSLKLCCSSCWRLAHMGCTPADATAPLSRAPCCAHHRLSRPCRAPPSALAPLTSCRSVVACLASCVVWCADTRALPSPLHLS